MHAGRPYDDQHGGAGGWHGFQVRCRDGGGKQERKLEGGTDVAPAPKVYGKRNQGSDASPGGNHLWIAAPCHGLAERSAAGDRQGGDRTDERLTGPQRHPEHDQHGDAERDHGNHGRGDRRPCDMRNSGQ